MVKFLAVLFFVVTGFQLFSQQRCSMEEYVNRQVGQDISLKDKLEQVDVFTRESTSSPGSTQRVNGIPEIITIPVVFHILYHTKEENIDKSILDRLISALNRDFNKKNSDSSNIPSVFKPYATSMGFEFKLAKMDPQGRGTTGIVKKYTPILYWMSDDKMKFSASYGDDAWDSKSYLNIWICNMKDVLGYSTFPGMDPLKDGVVLSIEDILRARGTTPKINDLRTVVHEVGHWVNLYHIWGEGYCGDDKVDDTPKQGSYTPGCPSGSRVTCSNGPTGDMYMNFMDFTDDVCMNMFTIGQRKRARILFEAGGSRNSILYSKGLNASMIESAALPDFYPKWYYAQVYPNPAANSVNIYFDHDERWIGKKIDILDMSGRVVFSKIIGSRIETIDVNRLTAGVYFIRAEKDGEKLQAKFVKL
jgi:Secretion system C-terminal sorting domain/Pregnancy-associated plasma protein-A